MRLKRKQPPPTPTPRERRNKAMAAWQLYLVLFLLLVSGMSILLEHFQLAAVTGSTALAIDRAMASMGNASTAIMSKMDGLLSGWESPTTTTKTHFQSLIREFETSDIRYYVYDDDKIRLPWIRNRAKNLVPPSWRPGRTWAKRFQQYARGEIQWLESLENSTLRTRNASEADFFVVPIPLSATFFWGSWEERVAAFRRVFDAPLFREFPEKHVSAIHTTEHHNFFTLARNWGFNQSEFRQFANTTLIKDYDYNRFARFRSKQTIDHRFRNVIGLGWSFAAADPREPYQLMTQEAWSRKKNWFFYHTAHAFFGNSDVYRAAFLDDGNPLYPDQGRALDVLAARWNKTRAEVNITDVLRTFEHQPVSIGGTIPKEDWLRDALDSKFCFFRYDDFALVLPEDDFLADPVGSLDALVNALSPSELERRLEGLKLMQRIMVADKADSLFVPALAKEIVAVMNE